jgi:ABC-type transport system involved in multi-copper enzyme maturation permease subunit
MRLLQGELRKLLKRPATFITLGVFLAVLLLLFLAVGASYHTVAELPANQGGGAQSQAAIRTLLTFPGAYTGLASFLASIGGLFAIAYGAAAAGADWGWGMIKVTVARGESRSRYILVKLLAVFLMLIPGTLAAFAVGVAAVALAATLAGLGTAGMNDATALQGLPWLLARSWLALGEQAAIGFAIATLARSQLAGLGVGIGIYFVESFAVSFWPEYVRYLPFSVVSSLLRDPADLAGGAALGRFTIDQASALVLVVGYIVASAIISAIALERAEITG